MLLFPARTRRLERARGALEHLRAIYLELTDEYPDIQFKGEADEPRGQLLAEFLLIIQDFIGIPGQKLLFHKYLFPALPVLRKRNGKIGGIIHAAFGFMHQYDAEARHRRSMLQVENYIARQSTGKLEPVPFVIVDLLRYLSVGEHAAFRLRIEAGGGDVLLIACGDARHQTADEVLHFAVILFAAVPVRRRVDDRQLCRVVLVNHFCPCPFFFGSQPATAAIFCPFRLS